MENLYISDLFGYPISNSSPIITINVNNTKELFINLTNESKSIWKYNKTLVDDFLFARNVSDSNFLQIGHILTENKKNPNLIILANKNICITPNGYDEIMNYSTGKILRLFNLTNNVKVYSPFLFYTNDIDNFVNVEINYIGIIPEQLLINYSEISTNNNSDELTSNDFQLLSSFKFGVKTISRTINPKTNFKLLNSDDKYMTVSENKITADIKLDDTAQLFSYNAQGELINDGKCLSHNNEKVTVESCNDASNQKWILSQNKILPSNNFGKCLNLSPLDNSSIELTDCDSSDSQRWNTEAKSFNDTNSYDSTMSSDYVWPKFKGKTLALVENKNPWFVNEKFVTKMDVKKSPFTHDNNYLDQMPHYQQDFMINMKNNQIYQSDFVMDPNDPTMGHGYSIKSRFGSPCQKQINEKLSSNSNEIEHFDGVDQKYLLENQILAIFILLAIILIIYKLWKSHNLP